MRILDLALKDLYQIFRDWKAALFLLAMPVAFTLMFGFIFGASGGEDGDTRFPVGVLNLDAGDIVTTQFIALLDTSKVIRPVLAEKGDAEDLAKQVTDGEWVAAVVIPAGYGAALRDGVPMTLEVVAEDNTNAGHVAKTDVQAMVTRLLIAMKAAQFSADALAEADPDATPSREAAFKAAFADATTAWFDPPFTVIETGTGSADVVDADDEATEVYGDNSFVHSSAGMMAQFAIAGLIGAAEVVVVERKSRTLQRMMTTAMSKPAIIIGHLLAMFVMVLAQLTMLMLFGQFLGVNYLHAPLASLLMLLAFSFFAAALGMLIGALSKTEEQVVMYSLIPMFVLSALGGAWMPLEFTPETFQKIAYLTPLAWAVDGLKDITVRGLGVRAVLQPVAILVGFGLVCLAVAVVAFRTD